MDRVEIIVIKKILIQQNKNKNKIIKNSMKQYGPMI
jgi:hypothetical protein